MDAGHTYELSYGVHQDFVPVGDDAFCIVLYQKLHAVLPFQLEERYRDIGKTLLNYKLQHHLS